MLTGMQRTRTGQILVSLATGLFFCALLVFVWAANMQKPLDHDEHMYVAAGVLFGRGGALPYRDYPYFQMPLLPAVYGAVLSLGPYKLLMARTLSTFCELGTVGILFYAGWHVQSGKGESERLLRGACSALLFLASPITYHTGGLAWNHDLPLFAALASFALLLFGSEHRGAMLLSGLLLGAAIDARLVFVLLAVPLLAGAISRPGVANHTLIWLAGGFIVGLLPAILMYVAAPGAFIFSNLTYHGVNALYRESMGYTRAMDIPGKLQYAWEVASEPASLVLVALLLFLSSMLWRNVRRAPRLPLWQALVGLAGAVSTVVAALLPTPSWYQYFYAAVPFLVFATLVLFAPVAQGPIARFGTIILTFATLLTLFYSVGDYKNLRTLSAFDSWATVAVHRAGESVARQAGAGKVLTLSPLYPLEGGRGIYPQLASGVFGWRNAPFIADADRERYHIIGAADLEQLCAADPPAAVLTGGEPDIEGALENYAREGGYAPTALSGGLTLWLPERK